MAWPSWCPRKTPDPGPHEGHPHAERGESGGNGEHWSPLCSLRCSVLRVTLVLDMQTAARLETHRRIIGSAKHHRSTVTPRQNATFPAMFAAAGFGSG